MTDAAHMLSDFAGFLISLLAIWISKRPPSRGMSFGWYRAGIMCICMEVFDSCLYRGYVYHGWYRVLHMLYVRISVSAVIGKSPPLYSNIISLGYSYHAGVHYCQVHVLF